MADGWAITVRQGGDAGDPTVDYTSQIPIFDVEPGSSTPQIKMGMRCDNGSASTSTIIIDDDLGEIPKADDTKSIAAHNLVLYTETVGGTTYWLGVGRVAPKDIGRNDARPWGDARTFQVTVEDANADVRGLVLTADWVRGAETGRARLAALAAAYLAGSPRFTTNITFSSTHLAPNANTVSMPAKTYLAGAMLSEVIQDCADVEAKHWSVSIHHTGGSHLCFEYKIATDHSTYLSALKISDVPADHNLTSTTVPVIPPAWEQGAASLEDGQELISALVHRYGPDNRALYIADAAQISDYDYWASSSFDNTSVTVTQATAKANAILTEKKQEHVTHQVSILLHRNQIHLVTAGMSIQIKSAAAMGGHFLGAYQTRLIAECIFEPHSGPPNAPEFYWAHLKLDRSAGTPAGLGSPSQTKTPTVPPICEPDTPGVPVWYWTWTANNLDDGSGTISGGLKRPTTNPYYPVADAAFGAQSYGYNTAGNRATQKFAISGNTPYVFSTNGILWQYTPSFRDITVQWFGTGGTVLLSTVTAIAGAGHATNSVYSEASTLTSPVGADMAVIDFSPFAGVYATDFYVSTAGTATDNDPLCVVAPTWDTATGEAAFLAPYNDTRFGADDQHLTSSTRQRVVNNAGATLSAGDVVVPDTSTDGPAVTRTTTASSTAGPIGIVLEGGADQANVVVQWGGVASFVNTNGTPADGDYLTTSVTAGVANVSATRSQGAFGRVVRDDGSGETLHVLLWGVPDPSGAAGSSGQLDWFIVTDPLYGAVGDDTTDDTAAITAAINAAIANQGGIVYFPAGTYKITSLITLTAGALQDGIHLMGAQAGDLGNNTGSVIHQATNNTGALLFATNIYQSYITNLFFHGPTTHASGIGIEHVRNVIYHNVSVNNFGTGVKMGVSSFYSKAYRLGVYNCTTGVLNANGSNNVDYYACRISTCTTGFSVQGSEKVAFYGGEVEACTTGILLDSGANMTSGVTVSGVYFENSAGSTDIRVGDTTSIKGVIITGNKFTAHTTGFHIDAQYVDGLVIQANDFRKTTGTAIRTQSPATGVLTGPNRYNGATDSLSGNARIIDPETDVSPAAVAAAAANGTSRYWPRADHVHARGTTPASTVSITDTGSYFTGTDVEAALQEIGAGGIGGGTSGTGSDHAHIVDELFSGDGATTVFSLANEAVTETAMAYIAGVRTPVTVGGAMNDEVTFTAAPGSGTDNVSIDYVAVSA